MHWGRMSSFAFVKAFDLIVENFVRSTLLRWKRSDVAINIFLAHSPHSIFEHPLHALPKNLYSLFTVTKHILLES